MADRAADRSLIAVVVVGAVDVAAVAGANVDLHAADFVAAGVVDVLGNATVGVVIVLLLLLMLLTPY